MSSMQDSEKALMAKESALVKVLTAIKKIVAKEFLWILVCIIISIPLAFIIDHLIGLYATEEIKTMIKSVTGTSSTFVGSYLIGVAGMYFSRIVKGAIETQLKTISAK